MKKALPILAALALCPAVAQADVAINVTAGLLYRFDGSPLPKNSTVVLLADLDRDGFGNLTNPNTFLADPQDFIVGRVGTDDIIVPGSLQQPFTFIGDPLLLAGLVDAPLALVWYDLPYSAGATSPGSNTYFGTYTDPIGIDGSAPWLFPASGTVSMNFLTQAAGGSNTELSARTNFATAPEPASMLMVLLAGGLLSARSRKRAR